MTNHDALQNNTHNPAHAYRTFEPNAIEQSKNQTTWQPNNPILPTLYISHGAPPLFEDTQWINELHQWALNMPKPTGIVIISAHWEKAPITITAPNPTTGLTYDFGGFRQYKTHAPGMPYAHPTVEHFTPLFTTLGAKYDNETPTTTIQGNFWGLSKRSLQYN